MKSLPFSSLTSTAGPSLILRPSIVSHDCVGVEITASDEEMVQGSDIVAMRIC